SGVELLPGVFDGGFRIRVAAPAEEWAERKTRRRRPTHQSSACVHDASVRNLTGLRKGSSNARCVAPAGIPPPLSVPEIEPVAALDAAEAPERQPEHRPEHFPRRVRPQLAAG